MKQVAHNYRSGELRVLDVPAPVCRPGGALVSTRYSLVSAGTEMMKVAEANLSLLGKARARPDQVRKVMDSVGQQGLRGAYVKAMRRLDSYTPLGYSSCGVVVEVATGVEDLRVGQLVACAGNEYALHAELNWVPRRLCVPVPDGVDPRLAAFATVGAIALQGLRRCDPQLGDTACVVGLGLVGQLVVQLLLAAGVRVVGLDPVPDRCRLAEKAGAIACDAPDKSGLERIEGALARTTGGLGADHVLLVAGGSSSVPVKAAARLARDRARVVDIGKLKMDLPWNDYYEKELDVRFSRSYGPGRYDETYELEGVDYPAGYVRWTEERNIKCFLDLLAHGQLAVDLLASETFPIEEAAGVYERMQAGTIHAVGVLFEYPQAEPLPGCSDTAPVATPDTGTHRVVGDSMLEGASLRARPLRPKAGSAGKLRIGFIGAGSYASSVLLPSLAKSEGVELALVATNTPLSAATAQRRFGFTEATTAVERLLDGGVDAMFIVTRHHSHAELVCRSLAAGVPTFVEKPLALSDEELSAVLDTARSTANDRLMVGFNRRFAPLLVDLRRRWGDQMAGSVIHYLVNAGPLASTSWYRNTAREGSRFVGEGGHFLDTIGWWLEAHPSVVHAVGTQGQDDLQVTVRYDDGSIAGIDYVTHGSPRYPKETIEMSAAGRTARFDNFRRATLWRGRRRSDRRAWGAPDKGQDRELVAFLDAVRTGGPMPIPLASLAATTAATLAVDRSIRAGGPVAVH